MDESHRVYSEQGLAAYSKYQIDHEEEPLAPGEAFPLVKKLLALNDRLNVSGRVEVILLSRNSALFRESRITSTRPETLSRSFKASNFLTKGKASPGASGSSS